MSPFRNQPLKKQFFTPGTFILLIMMGIGTAFGIARLLTGLTPVTNLTNSYPWGIWIAIDVACGVALAAGGFTTAAFIDIFGRKDLKPLLRPAILTAWLGYLMVAVGLLFDLGRYWNIYQPLFNWQGNSVMFELAMCVMAYLIVLTVEISPALLEGFRQRIEKKEFGWKILKKLEGPIKLAHAGIKLILPIFIIAGVVLSCMHQSSLGTLMVIAPTKLSALFYTTWLPLLFLLSAIMVGFPMVIIESLSASKALEREAEIDYLEPLAAKVNWFIGIYALFKFADLGLRSDQLNFTENISATVSFFVEIAVGLILPFILLQFKQIRRSRAWLITSSLLVVFGVVLNRLNVFLIGYKPKFREQIYSPSIGEISLTVGLIAFLIFLYRFFVNYFPILPVLAKDGHATEFKARTPRPIEPKIVWTFRGAAFIFLLSFIMIYVVVHEGAIAESKRIYKEVKVKSFSVTDKTASEAFTHDNRPEKYRNFYIIKSSLLNNKTDYYESVLFSHRTHDVSTDSDCSVCHHRFSDDPEDRVGQDLREMHEEIEVRIGGACSTCHDDMTEKEFQKCSACHLYSNEKDYPDRIGLKGAYHRQCIGCHNEQPDSAYAPTDCTSCHHPRTPDHTTLIALQPKPDPEKITARCLECHPDTGSDILKTAHWNWSGLTPAISGHEHDINAGLAKSVNNYTITMIPELANTYSNHIGYIREAVNSESIGTGQIDCLVCHDTTETYKKSDQTGLPVLGIDLLEIAGKVGRPTRKSCGSCHFYMGGGPNALHGDLGPVHAAPSPEDDFHMGRLNMNCQGCHKTQKHQIAGMSFVAPVTEGRGSCEICHGSAPHGITGYLSRHLDDHVKAVSCETCHIPSVARTNPTVVSTDFSTAGKDKKWGDQTWAKNVVPEYRWFDGSRNSHQLGDKIDPDSVVELNSPLGAKHIPSARIHPFKVHTANQPYDTKNNKLVAVKFRDGLWQHGNWNTAITDGMASVNQPFSGEHGFVKTKMYTSLHHEIVPAKKALGCADCHQVKAVSCTRCHTKANGIKIPSHSQMVYPDVKNRIDFKKLGYEDDPAYFGGRFYLKIGRGKPGN